MFGLRFIVAQCWIDVRLVSQVWLILDIVFGIRTMLKCMLGP
jgi:hypothetical protein